MKKIILPVLVNENEPELISTSSLQEDNQEKTLESEVVQTIPVVATEISIPQKIATPDLSQEQSRSSLPQPAMVDHTRANSNAKQTDRSNIYFEAYVTSSLIIMAVLPFTLPILLPLLILVCTYRMIKNIYRSQRAPRSAPQIHRHRLSWKKHRMRKKKI